MIFLLVIVIGLVAWALHLMQEAIQHREFSLMLAGCLVSSAAAALMAVYFLMGHYMGYVTEMAERSYSYDSMEWAAFDQSWAEMVNLPSSDLMSN
jgi:hypothetical protein